MIYNAFSKCLMNFNLCIIAYILCVSTCFFFSLKSLKFNLYPLLNWLIFPKIYPICFYCIKLKANASVRMLNKEFAGAVFSATLDLKNPTGNYFQTPPPQPLRSHSPCGNPAQCFCVGDCLWSFYCARHIHCICFRCINSFFKLFSIRHRLCRTALAYIKIS